MAARYWVGGTAAWDGTAGTKWALTSGGAGGQAVPTSSDDVYFDANSGAVTVTISTGNTNAGSITCTGFTGTLTGTAAISVFGNMTLVAGMTYSYTGLLTLSATGTGTLTSAGKTFGSITISTTTGTIATADALTLGTGTTLTLTQGTFSLGGTVTTGIFSSSNTNTRAINFNSYNIYLKTTGTNLSMATTTGCSFSGTGGFAINTAISATLTCGSTAGTAAPNFFVTGTVAPATTFTSTSNFQNVDFSGGTNLQTASGSINISGNLTCQSGSGITIVTTFNTTGTIKSNGQTGLGNMTISAGSGTVTLADALTLPAASTFTLNTGTLDLGGNTLTCSFTSSNTNTRSISWNSGSIAITGNTYLSMATVTGFSYTGTSNFTSSLNSSRTFNFGGTSGSTESQRPNITVSGPNTYAPTFTGAFKQITFSGTNSPGAATVSCSGFTLSTGVYTSTTFSLVGTGTVNTSSTTAGTINVNATGITTTLVSACSVTTLTLTNGTLDLSGYTLTASTVSTAAGTKNLTFNGGTIIVNTSGATAWNNANPTGFTTTQGTSIGTINMNSLSAKTFVGGGSIYNCKLVQSNTGALTITGANTFLDIGNTVQPATVSFTAGTTNTFTNFSLSGTAGNLITINSATAATHTLSKASGIVSVSYCSITNSAATGGAGWYAGNTSTNGGGNSGWIFSNPPTNSGNFLMFFG